VTERSVARHRALHKPGSSLSALTGSLSVVGDYVGSARRSGVIIAMSSGLVASMALPAHAVTVSSPVEAAGPQTASVPAIPSSEQAAAGAFFAAPEAGLLALPPEMATNDFPVVAPAAATVEFDHTAFTPVKTGSLVDRMGAGATAPQSGKQARLSITEGGDNGQAAPTATHADAPAAPKRASTASMPHLRAPARQQSQTAASQASHSGSSVLAVASRYLGVPYRWGGTTPAGFDCSGFTKYVYGVLGKELPRTVAQQRAAVRIVSRSQARPGDLVIFGETHIAIYAGDGMMYDAPHRGMSVTKRKIYSSSVSFGRV
jgi:cell wall-associated NlpC family hydrolase